MFRLKAYTLSTGREDVRNSAGGVVGGEMMELVPRCVTDASVANVLLSEHTQEAPLAARVEHT